MFAAVADDDVRRRIATEASDRPAGRPAAVHVHVYVALYFGVRKRPTDRRRACRAARCGATRHGSASLVRTGSSRARTENRANDPHRSICPLSFFFALSRALLVRTPSLPRSRARARARAPTKRVSCLPEVSSFNSAHFPFYREGGVLPNLFVPCRSLPRSRPAPTRSLFSSFLPSRSLTFTHIYIYTLTYTLSLSHTLSFSRAFSLSTIS